MTFAHILGQVDSVMISYKRASPSHCYRIVSYEDALFSKFPGKVKPVLSWIDNREPGIKEWNKTNHRKLQLLSSFLLHFNFYSIWLMCVYVFTWLWWFERGGASETQGWCQVSSSIISTLYNELGLGPGAQSSPICLTQLTSLLLGYPLSVPPAWRFPAGPILPGIFPILETWTLLLT